MFIYERRKRNKKYLIMWFVPIFAILLGFSAWALVDNFDKSSTLKEKPSFDEIIDVKSEIDTQKSDNTTNTDISKNEVTFDTESTTKELSNEDIALKNEIAKVAPNAADFRYSRTETIKGKRYELTFSNMGGSYGIDEKEKITYVNSVGEEFTYSLNTGKLTLARLKSAMTAKNADSIDKITAQNIAYAYASEGGDISNYVLGYTDIDDEGYTFIYHRCISGYNSSDSIHVSVGYDGAIVEVNDKREEYIGKNIVVNEAKLQKEINDMLQIWIGIFYLKS